jgi:hypothetical protein
MAIAVKNNTVYAVEIEVTEGTYVPPAADTSYVQVLADGAEMTPSKELLERNVFNGSIGKSTPRTGTKSVAGAIPVEMRAGATEGLAPEYDKLLRSALGSRRQASATTIDDADAGSSHTTSRAYLLDASANKYFVGDSVTIKVAGAYHTSPVTAVSNTAGDVYIDLLIPAAAPFVNGQVIMALTTYTVANAGHPSLSISKYIEEAVLEQATGCRVSSMALENFTTGQLASFNFGFEGLSFDRSLTAQPHTPNFSNALPPIILEACVFQDGDDIAINEFAFSLENTLGFATSTCSANGRISGRASERVITGTFNPYKHDDNIDQFTKFVANTEFSLFGSAKVPTTTPGEYGQVVAFYMPQCIATELAETDQDGLLQEEVSFSAARGGSGEQDELYISFS